jgi:transcriptional regulator with XRE-family HTH domain
MGKIVITPKILKEIRFKNNDMSQQEMADILEVSKQYISDLERGKKPISLNFEKKLIEKGLVLEQKQEIVDADMQQVMDLYTKFRDNKDIEAGELLEEKIHLMLKILKSQK